VYSEIYKELSDLRGHCWATVNKESLSGKSTMLNEVKKIGYNASFFGNIVSSGNSWHISLLGKISQVP